MRISTITFAVIALLASTPASAQIADWRGLATENWFNDVNWNPEAIPAAGINVIIDTTSPNPTTLAGAATPSLGAVQVGPSGTGDLLIELGGKLNNNGIGILGTQPDSLGFVTIRDAGSEWRIDNNLVVGEQGAGLLQLRSSGYLLNNNARIGNSASGFGAASVWSGSNWVSLGNLFVAHSGSGSLDIRGGDSAVFNQAQAFVGYAGGGEGSVRVRQGGGWASFADVFIGREGQGKLDIESGGVVVVTSDSSSFVGALPGGAGEVTVTGPGSRWTTTASLIVGVSGNGQLDVANGGEVTADILSIGDLETGVGAVTVGEDAVLSSDNDILVGRLGSGSLFIEGGEVNSGRFGLIGNDPGGFGEVHLTASARWTSQESVFVGNFGSGVLTIGPDAELISGGGVRVSTVPGGSARLDLSGSLTANAARGGTQVDGGGLLRGTGLIDGGLTVRGLGFVAPGLDPGEIGELQVSRLNMDSVDAVLRIDLGPPPISDRIIVSGDVILNGLLHASDAGGFAPGVYTLITYTGTLTDSGLAIDLLPPLPPGYGAWIDTSTQPGEVRLVIDELSDEVFSDRFEI